MENLLKQFLFFPQANWDDTPQNWHLTSEEVTIATPFDVNLSAWWLPSPEHKATILLFHGNAGNISHRLFKAEPLIRKGYNVLLVDYRGYGKSTGDINKVDDLYEDGEASLVYLEKNKGILANQIVLFGESLGSVVALELASKHTIKAVILEGAFTSAEDLIKKHYPFVPSFFLKNFKADNLEKIKKVSAPVLIIHGSQDEICPPSMADFLFQAASGPKELFKVEGADHNNIPIVAEEKFAERIDEFIQTSRTL